MAEPDLSTLQAQLDANPKQQQALALMKAANYVPADPRFQQGMALLDEVGRSLGGLPKGYGVNAVTGKIEQKNWLERHGKQLGVSLLAGGVGGGALLGVGAGAPAAATPAYTSTAAANAGLSGGLIAPATGTAATTAAAASTPSLLHSLLPTIIGAGASLGGAAIAGHANTEAAKIAAAQADKALEIQKEQYALQRQDTAPYRALGQGAVGNLGYLSGIDVASNVPALSSTVPTTPYGQQAPAQSGTLVPMKTPDGRTLGIPRDQVATAQAHGAQVVS